LGLKLLHNNFGSGGKIIEPNAADEIMQPDPALQRPRDFSPVVAKTHEGYCHLPPSAVTVVTLKPWQG
jgi:hypothetical protein